MVGGKRERPVNCATQFHTACGIFSSRIPGYESCDMANDGVSEDLSAGKSEIGTESHIIFSPRTTMASVLMPDGQDGRGGLNIALVSPLFLNVGPNGDGLGTSRPRIREAQYHVCIRGLRTEDISENTYISINNFNKVDRD